MITAYDIRKKIFKFLINFVRRKTSPEPDMRVLLLNSIVANLPAIMKFIIGPMTSNNGNDVSENPNHQDCTPSTPSTSSTCILDGDNAKLLGLSKCDSTSITQSTKSISRETVDNEEVSVANRLATED